LAIRQYGVGRILQPLLELLLLLFSLFALETTYRKRRLTQHIKSDPVFKELSARFTDQLLRQPINQMTTHELSNGRPPSR